MGHLVHPGGIVRIGNEFYDFDAVGAAPRLTQVTLGYINRQVTPSRPRAAPTTAKQRQTGLKNPLLVTHDHDRDRMGEYGRVGRQTGDPPQDPAPPQPLQSIP